MSYARNWADSDVLIKELGGGKVSKYLSVINSFLIIILFEGFELSSNAIIDRVEHSDKVKRLLLEIFVLSKSSKLHKSSLRPVRDLIIDYVDFLETFLKLRLVTTHIGQILVHLDNLLIIWVHFRCVSIIIASLDLQLLHLCHQLFILLFELVDLGLAA